ncbi:hypothetical protein ACFPRL_09130 [Pseudoclavibacter helvolus]
MTRPDLRCRRPSRLHRRSRRSARGNGRVRQRRRSRPPLLLAARSGPWRSPAAE